MRMVRARRLSVAWTLAAMAASQVSCASLSETQHFVAYGDDGESNYYRIKLEGSGSVGEMEYSSGWYSAAAVDQLFGDLEATQGAEAELAQVKRGAAVKALKAYVASLTADELDSEAITARKRAYEQLLGTITTLAPVGTDRIGATDYADKKLVFVLSNDPSAIVDAITSRVQGRTLVDALSKKLAAEDRRATSEAARELAAEVEVTEALVQSLETTRDAIGAATTEDALRQALARQIAELEAE